MNRPLLTLTLLLGALSAQAQRTVVVADATTREAVAYASLYCREGGQFHSCVSDEHGRAAVGFAFSRLTVSHLNYERRTLRHLPDTILLQPRFQHTREVVVTNAEPAWIRQKLKQVVREKEQRYLSSDSLMGYDYLTRSIGRDALYQYHSDGTLRPRGHGHRQYAICQRHGTIAAIDSTRLTDTANLRRMLYEDFMEELDAAFIRNHRFGENPDYQGRTPAEIELYYRAKHHPDDRGRIVIDTARCIILSATRFTGTETNKRERMSPVLYSLARLITGYRITKWTRDYRVSYAQRTDGTCYPAEVRYKLYMETPSLDEDPDEEAYHQQTGGGFPNMEATLRLRPGGLPADSDRWEQLPPSWYIRYSTDAGRQREIELANLDAKFQFFDE